MSFMYGLLELANESLILKLPIPKIPQDGQISDKSFWDLFFYIL